jgi:hypothetical protein
MDAHYWTRCDHVATIGWPVVTGHRPERPALATPADRLTVVDRLFPGSQAVATL